MSKPKIGELVEIAWMDSRYHGGGWVGLRTAQRHLRKTALRVHWTAGYLIYLDKKIVGVADSWFNFEPDDPGTNVASPVSIPRACVLSIRRLKSR